MVTIVKTIATKVEDGFRLIKAQVMGKNDIQTPAEATPFGIDSNPVKDMAAIYAPSTVKGEPVIIGYIQKNRLSEVGALRMYSTDTEGEEQNYLWLRADGTIEVGGHTDNLVRYSKLETAFNELKADYNNFLTAFNGHTHPTPSGPSSVPTPVSGAIPASPSAADISPAKINEIKTS